MGCDYIEETCLEIKWLDNKSSIKTFHYVLNDFTKYKYFYNDYLDVSNELIINFIPVVLYKDNKYVLDENIEFFEKLNMYSDFDIKNWLARYLFDWLNPNSFDDIVNGTYIGKFNSIKIVEIKLIKRNLYIDKYYYY